MIDPVRLPERRPEPVREGLSVFVRGLKVQAFIGVYAHEKGRTQPLIVDAELALHDAPVETLADTVDYERVAEAARAIAAAGHVELVEDYAERLARVCLQDPRVTAVRVRVDKPEALPGAEAAGCEVRFRRG